MPQQRTHGEGDALTIVQLGSAHAALLLARLCTERPELENFVVGQVGRRGSSRTSRNCMSSYDEESERAREGSMDVCDTERSMRTMGRLCDNLSSSPDLFCAVLAALF